MLVTVSNSGHGLQKPDGTLAAGTFIEFRTVDALSKQPIEGWTTTGETITTSFVVATTDLNGVFSVSLWPTTLMYGNVLYRIRSLSGLFDTFYANLPAVNSTLIELRASQIPLTAAEMSALTVHIETPGLHLPQPIGADGSFLKVVAGAPKYVAVAPGLGDMTASVYDTNEDGKVNAADTADTVPWSGVSNKPDFFPYRIPEFVTGTDVPTGKYFTIVKYDDGEFGWVEL